MTNGVHMTTMMRSSRTVQNDFVDVYADGGGPLLDESK